MRNLLPSSESQNPSTCHRLRPSADSNHPLNSASVKGFRAWGHETLAVTSTISYAEISGEDWLKETFRGRTLPQEGKKTQELSRRIKAIKKLEVRESTGEGHTRPG
jgi:hypothetical protein